ncbi:cytochrome P450 [Gordonia alkanivorans]|uniref:Cytochrome P450 n=1 Tax=Gordonia alkanivorans CGMCC 6845 TaxID=1423140 RepID=W9DKM8_9ACTN|nr:cytochrome P450 [Gordonia alkanivorans]ETA07310.1 cytochrome P450 [Gordonia alkanivorans CGMCC 6845]MDJ0006715.1 cytochrome P450 [Gordonia alkanivorans]MDJ0097321.1 cytochrome P450 [Gordonia alkanivorans]MDJ0492343.1 cytochrome P450 [Gordonia alkanivorans]
MSTSVLRSDPHLPPATRVPSAMQGLAAITSRRLFFGHLHARHGTAFTVHLPVFGRAVVISDASLARELFTAGDKVINIQPNLGRILGAGSIFSLEGREHRARRKLLTPPLHGKRMKTYEQIVEEEVQAETSTWPVETEFASMEPMMRITLNVILRAVFGAVGEDLENLRRIIPPMVTVGSRAATVPNLPRVLRAVDPNHRYERMRAEGKALLGDLITRSRNDPRLEERDDILALMLRSRYDDGASMGDDEIGDELMTMLAAGHETTGTTLAWAFERLRRHPEVLGRLVAEVDEGGTEYRHATILETQRSRPVIDFAARYVVADQLELGEWRIPRGYNVMVSIALLHDDSREFTDPERFDPTRFLGTAPSPAWLPFGGGTRRCIGAAFATMEMDVALRTILSDFELLPTDARAERWFSRGVAYAPARGGRIAVRRRR